MKKIFIFSILVLCYQGCECPDEPYSYASAYLVFNIYDKSTGQEYFSHKWGNNALDMAKKCTLKRDNVNDTFGRMIGDPFTFYLNFVNSMKATHNYYIYLPDGDVDTLTIDYAGEEINKRCTLYAMSYAKVYFNGNLRLEQGYDDKKFNYYITCLK